MGEVTRTQVDDLNELRGRLVDALEHQCSLMRSLSFELINRVSIRLHQGIHVKKQILQSGGIYACYV